MYSARFEGLALKYAFWGGGGMGSWGGRRVSWSWGWRGFGDRVWCGWIRGGVVPRGLLQYLRVNNNKGAGYCAVGRQLSVLPAML